MDLTEIVRALFALIAVLGMIGLAGLGLQRARALNLTRAARAERRLSIVETQAIDAKRRLALVRCGAHEHLLLLSPGGDLVIAQMAAEETTATKNPFSKPSPDPGDAQSAKDAQAA